MINQKIRDHLIKYHETHGWTKEYGFDLSDDGLIGTIRETDCISRKEIEKHRWWTDYRYVIEIDGMFIEYEDAEWSGDGDTGYEFDPETIREVNPVKRMIEVTEYVPVEENKEEVK